MDPASRFRASGLPPGTRVGRYTLMRRFAVGGMAELYLAHQRGPEGFGKIVALKRILPHLAADPVFTRMFLDEARLAAGLDHPNIAQVLDFGESDGEYFLTMEYVHGRHLLDVLRAQDGRPLPLVSALGIVGAVARALHHVHELRGPEGRPMGLVHRDVSPSNVLISYEGTVKLTDFGIAKAMELTSATRTGTFKGKLGYASPEQVRGEAIDRRSDVYALGILLYETTTGVRAFSGPNEFAVLGRVAKGDFVRPEEIDPGYPLPLRRVIARALATDADDRYATAAAFADDLEELERALDLRATPTRVAAVMHESFGEAPPVAAEDELQLATRDPTEVARSGLPPQGGRKPALRRSAWVPWVGAAAIVSVVVAWAWTRPVGQAAPPPAAAPAPAVVSELPARETKAAAAPPPVVVPAPVIVPPAEPPADSDSEDEDLVDAPAASARSSSRKASRSKRRRSRKANAAAEAPAGGGLDDLYPPGHDR